jgi:hypothetical protein
VKRLVFLPLLALLPLVLSCDDSAMEAVVGPDLSLQASSGGETAVVTGSGHYVNSAGNWRNLSFHVRQNPDGSVPRSS